MNRLGSSASPYLRQHASNPVAWWPWCPEAFAEAARRDVPVLISIGYATCHWCHVMAHESFEDADTAALMNQHLVCIKVDREEHPEVDEIYMDAVQAIHGHGGWPLNAFADHTGQPFYALTYLPRAHWQQVIRQIGVAWRADRERLRAAATEVALALQREAAVAPAPLGEGAWSTLAAQVHSGFDAANPGWTWGGARQPKFPASPLLRLICDLCGDATLPMRALAAQNLEAMQDSGLHDRVGGGFHRYSVDAEWRVPHFEKMLYDNAQLSCAYATAGLRLGRADFLRTAINAGDYLLRDLALHDGTGALSGLASAEDADDPHGEGSFYAWPPAELERVLGAEAGAALAQAWNISPGQAHVGRSGHAEPVTSHIPHPRGNAQPPTEAGRLSWEAHLPALRIARDARPRPIRDDKLLSDLNGMACEALATLARLTGEARFTDACSALCAVLRARHTPDGLLRMAAVAGQAPRPAYITDYAQVALGLIAAFNLLGDASLVGAAAAIVDEAVAKLAAPDGGFFNTPAGRSDLVRRSRSWLDGAVPCGQAGLALAAVRLHALTGSDRYATVASGVLRVAGGMAQRVPHAAATLLQAAGEQQRGHLHAVVAGPADDPRTLALLAACRRSTISGLCVVPVEVCREQPWPCLDARRDISEPQALICAGTRCLAPARDAAQVADRLAEMERSLPR